MQRRGLKNDEAHKKMESLQLAGRYADTPRGKGTIREIFQAWLFNLLVGTSMFGKSSKKCPRLRAFEKDGFFSSQGAKFRQEIVLMDKILDLYCSVFYPILNIRSR